MHAKINHRPAARQRLVAKPAARVTVAAQVGCLRIIDLAHGTVVNEIAHHGIFGGEAEHKADHQELARLICLILHHLCLGGVICHRLFANDMQACAQRGNGAACVIYVPHANVGGIQLLFGGKHCLNARVAMCGIKVKFFACFFKALGVDIANGSDLNVRDPTIRLQMRVGNIARTDHTDLNCFHDITSEF